MKNQIKLAVFDMDGTILDTLEDLQDSLNFALAKMGYPLRTYEEVRSFVGNGIRKLIERAYLRELLLKKLMRHIIFLWSIMRCIVRIRQDHMPES